MIDKASVSMIRIRGNYREMGHQIGEQCAPLIHKMLKSYRKTFEDAYDELQLTWEEAVLQANKYYPYAQEHTPQYVQELEGMAEAAEVGFDDLMVLNCTEAITSDVLHLGCTSMAVSAERTKNGHVLVGHNEDWLPEDEENTYLIHATPEDAPPFLAITYGGLLPNIGFNAAGIAQCCDSVYPSDVRVGVPRIFVSRAVLGMTRIAEAIRKTLIRWRAAGYNHLIADNHGELYNVEVSAHHFATIYGIDGYLVHTNNYLTQRMKQVEARTDDLIGSRVRVNRAQRLLRQVRYHDVESIKTLLSDHVNFPNSICSHSEPDAGFLDRQKTIASLIMNLTALEMHFCWGNPCTGSYETYRLEV
jgi:isopenicillin-N N-acyltransferase-like protein